MCGREKKAGRVGGRSRLVSALAAMHFLLQVAATAFLWAVPAFGYRLFLYHGMTTALLMTLLLTALSAGMIFGKGLPGRWGSVFAMLMPFGCAASVLSMLFLHEPGGMLAGLWTTGWTFAAFVKCVPERKKRMGAACAALTLLPVGLLVFLPVMHPEMSMKTGEAFLSVSVNLLFGFVWLGGGALAVLCSCLNARWQKNLFGVLAFAMCAFQLMVFCVMVELSQYGGMTEETPASCSALSPDGKMLAELVQDEADGSHLYVRMAEDIEIGVGFLRGERQAVYWPHYGSAQIETIEWQDEAHILINGSAYPMEQRGE